ncbi:unnamed protein product [Pieris brassicae]|uniref:Uncharacterized protein n=1 Tax=Pieris brassicae TaxID=7116 RepID=A0A9P0TPX4_PIEBR|nr:unnamed protein product [Pieris brassicae]
MVIKIPYNLPNKDTRDYNPASYHSRKSLFEIGTNKQEKQAVVRIIDLHSSDRNHYALYINQYLNRHLTRITTGRAVNKLCRFINR